MSDGSYSGGSNNTQYFVNLTSRNEQGTAPNTNAELMAAGPTSSVVARREQAGNRAQRHPQQARIAACRTTTIPARPPIYCFAYTPASSISTPRTRREPSFATRSTAGIDRLESVRDVHASPAERADVPADRDRQRFVAAPERGSAPWTVSVDGRLRRAQISGGPVLAVILAVRVAGGVGRLLGTHSPDRRQRVQLQPAVRRQLGFDRIRTCRSPPAPATIRTQYVRVIRTGPRLAAGRRDHQ